MINKNLPYNEIMKLAESIIYDANAILNGSKYLSGMKNTLSKNDQAYLDVIRSDKDGLAAYLIDWCWSIKRNTDNIKEKIWAWQDKK